MHRAFLLRFLSSACVLITAPCPLAGQGRPSVDAPSYRFAAGVAIGFGVSDVAGVTPGAPIMAAQVETEFGRWVVGQVALGRTRVREGLIHPRSYYFPEAQLHLQAPLGQVRPYVGVGMGARFQRGAGNGSGTTFGASAGLRAAITSRIELRSEVRGRATGTYGSVESHGEWTVGAARRF